MSCVRRRIQFALVGACWAAAVTFGLMRLWAYEAAAGTAARAPLTWPTDSRVSRVSGMPTLVLLIHPKCPCSRATIAELAKVMTDCRGKLAAIVLMLRPTGVPVGWERTDLWESAAAIPGVSVIADAEGVEARRFGAATSGQALLYESDGRLSFRGGITASRGHQGDNDGRSAITSLVLHTFPAASAPTVTPVYGCPLLNDPQSCSTQGISQCQTK